MRWLNGQRIERGIRFFPFVPGPGFSLPPPAGQGMAEPLLIFDRRYPCGREMRLANSKKTDKTPELDKWTSGTPMSGQCRAVGDVNFSDGPLRTPPQILSTNPQQR
jgi:hypothetical protein